jgi:hypothetical protein
LGEPAKPVILQKYRHYRDSNKSFFLQAVAAKKKVRILITNTPKIVALSACVAAAGLPDGLF